MDAWRGAPQHPSHAIPGANRSKVIPMFHTPVQTRFAIVDRLLAHADQPPAFPAAMDLCRHQVAAGPGDDVARFAAEARKSASRHAFKAAFSSADWQRFASFCVVRRLPEGCRVHVPGSADRTLRFLVEGSLWQEGPGSTRAVPRQPGLLLPGAIVGEDAIFSDAPLGLEVRALEDSRVLELSLTRRKELTAACPAIAFELLRAAGAVLAARNRAGAARAQLATA